MAQRCKTCDHDEREVIDRALVAGASPVEIAARHGLSARAVRRHAESHLPATLAAAHEAREAVRADGLLERLREINRETQAILADAKKAEDGELALRAIARLEKQLELEARLLGELHEAATVNVHVNLFASPEWQAALAVILRHLTAHPSLRAVIARDLERLGHGAERGGPRALVA